MYYSNQYWEDLVKVQSAIPNLHHLRHSKILVTGAGGLIGSAVVDLLISINETANAGNLIYLAVRSEEKIRRRFGPMMSREDLVFFPYDAIEPIKQEIPFDYIIHTASPANPAAYASYPVETMLAILNGTSHLLKYAFNNGTKRLVYVSSSEVYGRKENPNPYCETDYGFVDILNPRACYPSAKRAAETLCSAFFKEYGVDAVIVRPGHVYGPTATAEDNRASSQFFRDVLNDHDIVMKSAGTQLRSYCYVVDCASAILAILLNGISSTAYNISNRNSLITIRQLAQMIADCSGKQVVFENPSDVELGSYNLMDNSSLNSELLEELGWASSFDAFEGICHTLSIMRDNSNKTSL